MNREQSHSGREGIESAMGEFRASMLALTHKEGVSYDDMIHVVGALVNDEHIFYTVVEELFTEAMLEWQRSKSGAYQARILRLVDVITGICGLSS